MRVYIDLNSRAFVVSPVLTQRVSELLFTRRDVMPIEVQFVRNSAVVELSAGATGKIGLKESFAASLLAYDGSWEKTGSGSATIYTFTLNLNTEELNALFPTDLEEAISCKLEVEYNESGRISSTLPTSAVVYNDILRGTEGSPIVATTASSFNLQSPNGTVFAISLTNDGALQTDENAEAVSAPTAFALVAPDLARWQIGVTNDGILTTTVVTS
jgi:hypothetical protein